MVKAANGQIVKSKGRKTGSRRGPEHRRKAGEGNMDGQDGQDEGGEVELISGTEGVVL